MYDSLIIIIIIIPGASELQEAQGSLTLSLRKAQCHNQTRTNCFVCKSTKAIWNITMK